MSTDKNNNIFQRVWNSGWRGYIIIMAIFLVGACAYPGSNIFTWISARREMKQQERQIRELVQEIMAMDERIHDLTDDKDSLERFAREHFHFAEKGEDVYLIEE